MSTNVKFFESTQFSLSSTVTSQGEHSYLRHKAHQGTKVSRCLKAQGTLEARAFLSEAHPT